MDQVKQMISEEIIFISLDEIGAEEREKIEQKYMDTDLGEACLFSYWDWSFFIDSLSGMDQKLVDEIEKKLEQNSTNETDLLRILIMTLCISFIDGGVIIPHDSRANPEAETLIELIRSKNTPLQINVNKSKNRSRIFNKQVIYFAESRSSVTKKLLNYLIRTTFNLSSRNEHCPRIIENGQVINLVES